MKVKCFFQAISLSSLFMVTLTGADAPGSLGNPPTVRVPLCLEFPDSKKYVPCTGVLPVDKTTGNALSWDDVLKGTPTNPSYVQESSRRIHWNENASPLAANDTFVGQIKDDGSVSQSTRWSLFSCFVISDQIGTLNLQSSDNGIVWFNSQSRAISAGSSLYLSQQIFTRYWRCSVTNGNVDEGALRLYSVFSN